MLKVKYQFLFEAAFFDYYSGHCSSHVNCGWLVSVFFDMIYILWSVLTYGREELEKQRAHERYMKLQEQGKSEQARQDLGE